jgi:hypothetical protein
MTITLTSSAMTVANGEDYTVTAVVTDPDARPRADCIVWGGYAADVSNPGSSVRFAGPSAPDCNFLSPSCDVPSGGGTATASITTSFFNFPPGPGRVTAHTYSGAPGCPGDLGTYSDEVFAEIVINVTG